MDVRVTDVAIWGVPVGEGVGTPEHPDGLARHHVSGQRGAALEVPLPFARPREHQAGLVVEKDGLGAAGSVGCVLGERGVARQDEAAVVGEGAALRVDRGLA